MRKILFLITGLSMAAGCQSTVNKAIQETKYSAYEMLGYQKRDLFKKEVKNVKENQEETGESLKDALERLKEIYAFDGGNLEKQYRSLNSSYETSQKKAAAVKSSIKQLETVAQDLFAEWKKEITEISAPDLRAKSTAQLQDAQAKYKEFHGGLKKSEGKLDPVMVKLRDQVLYLKHNLNRQAITGLKSESLKIQGDIDSLIKDMNTSISQAEQFIKTME